MGNRSKRRNATHNLALCICKDCREDLQAGKRMADALNLYRVGLAGHWDDLKSKWMAFRLSDGSSDGALYDSKADAVRHQFDEFLCCYICFVNLVGGANMKECAIFLNFTRDAYDAGFRLPDPMDVAPTAGHVDAVRGIVRAGLDRLSAVN